MAKSKPDRKRRTGPDAAVAPPAADAERGKADSAKPARKDGARETVESIVVAFILAFLFRTFEAEAFVIPTGSMAPTLYGRHKDVECPKCGTHFTIGASGEVGSGSDDRPPGTIDDTGLHYPHARLETAYCPNCRYEVPVRDLPVFNGDRILVNKWPYEFGDPARWDVVVFKFPENPKTNYIKRLVGLPGEEISIERGDVYARGPDGERRILRKEDPDKQMQLQLLVYDDRHPPRELLSAGWPERWTAVAPSEDPDDEWTDDPGGWEADREERSYSIDTEADDWRWLRYRHYLPVPADWEALPRLRRQPRAELITDFLSYNAHTPVGPNETPDLIDGEFWSGLWVGDLTLRGRLRVETTAGEFLLELVEGFRRYRCTIDLATGVAKLAFLEEGLDRDAPLVTPLATGTTPLGTAGTYNFAFANVDRRLVLWIDGSIVEFDADTTCPPAQLPGPHRSDLSPAGIAARNSNVGVDRLELLRDVYYRAEKYASPFAYVYEINGFEELAQRCADPEAWAEFYERHHRTVTFESLAENEFLMLGDNSAKSQDSRLWSNRWERVNRHAVPRSALVGKAFFVYWPHGVPFGNDGKGYSGFARHIPGLNQFFFHREIHPGNRTRIGDYPAFSVPFYPQVNRMDRIR